MADPPRWTHEEAGWYSHPTLGGVVFETAATAPALVGPKRGWWWYDKRMADIRGPFPTATGAIQEAEDWGG